MLIVHSSIANSRAFQENVVSFDGHVERWSWGRSDRVSVGSGEAVQYCWGLIYCIVCWIEYFKSVNTVSCRTSGKCKRSSEAWNEMHSGSSNKKNTAHFTFLAYHYGLEQNWDGINISSVCIVDTLPKWRRLKRYSEDITESLSRCQSPFQQSSHTQ